MPESDIYSMGQILIRIWVIFTERKQNKIEKHSKEADLRQGSSLPPYGNARTLKKNSWIQMVIEITHTIEPTVPCISTELS